MSDYLPEPRNCKEALLYKLCIKKYPPGSDTITWDGNTEGLVHSDNFTYAYKVSDNVLIMDDLADGGKFAYGSVTYKFTVGDLIDTGNGIIYYKSAHVFFVSENGVGVAIEDLENISFPEPGLYFLKANSASYVKYLTINGYTGFPITE